MAGRCRYCVAANRPCDRRHHRGRTLFVTVYPFKMGLTSKSRKPGFFRMTAPFIHANSNENYHLNLARLLSQAPRSLTREQAEELLRKNRGSVRRAAREARRMAADDPKVVQPVPEVSASPPFVYKNLRHAMNSCYIASTITACFAVWDAWDALLSAPNDVNNVQTEKLRDALRNVVNGVRLGKAVSENDVEKLRGAMVSLGFPGGKHQEDATHFFSALVENLNAPLMPLHEELRHTAKRDEGDERLIAERFIWLSFFNNANEETSLDSLLSHAFFGEKRNGLRRQSTSGNDVVDAWCHRLVLPEYTPSTQAELGYTRNSFDTITVPLALKRYGEDLNKRRTPVHLPLKYNFNRFVKLPGNERDYSLQLKSVVCHLGSRRGVGHYVSYTHDQNGWRRWDDLVTADVEVISEAEDGMPNNSRWREEIMCDSYMMFYELVPGEGSSQLEQAFDRQLSEGLVERMPNLDNELSLACSNDEMIAKYDQAMADADLAYFLQLQLDEEIIRNLQMRDDEEIARNMEDAQNEMIARDAQMIEDQEYAVYVGRLANEREQIENDEIIARNMNESVVDDTNRDAQVRNNEEWLVEVERARREEKERKTSERQPRNGSR